MAGLLETVTGPRARELCADLPVPQELSLELLPLRDLLARWVRSDAGRRGQALHLAPGQRLLARADLPPALRVLCEAMQRNGRKAEQESWL